MEVEIVYFNKADARVVRVVVGDWVELELPGYKERFFVELSDPMNVGPARLTTITAKAGATGDLYLSTAYLFANRIVADFGDPKRQTGKEVHTAQRLSRVYSGVTFGIVNTASHQGCLEHP